MQRALTADEFLEAWKRESDGCTDVIFGSLPIEGPVLSGEMKQEAVEAIMRVVWFLVDTPNKEEALRKNWDAVEKYTSDLVDKAVAENWKHLTASR